MSTAQTRIMDRGLTAAELASVSGGRGAGLQIGGASVGLKPGYSPDLPPPAGDLRLMARRGFSDQLHYQRYRMIMQGISGHPLLPTY